MAALHEVRNPLNGIVLTLEYIADSLTHQIGGPELEDELKNLDICASQQHLLLKSAMDLDKLMAGNKELPKEAFNPLQLCRDTVAMNAHSAKKGVAIKLSAASPEADSSFMGAPTQLILVLVNLLSNAAKFTTEGQIELSVAVKETSDHHTILDHKVLDHKILRFAVKDTGPGVPKAMQESIFGMRGQAGNDSSQAKGFGFGLFVAHELVERMGGQIKLLSPATAEGKGSEFSFELQVDKCEVQPGAGMVGFDLNGAQAETSHLGDRLKRGTQQPLNKHIEGTYRALIEDEDEDEDALAIQGLRVLCADDSEMNLMSM